MAYELAPLPYDYAALEPFIDAETMHLHHDKHHKAYINGHANHAGFWELMGPVSAPGIGGHPSGAIATQISADFGDFDTFKKTFNETTAKQFGSGWGWLVFEGSKLKIVTTPNQDSPWSQGHYPILYNDIWEHAYYLKYQNRRPDYLAAWWNVINWDEVNRRFAIAKG